MDSAREVDTPVLVVGAGPAGLIASLQLARHGTPSILVERNPDTTKWPKMDITNCRSMELLTRMGIADGLREVGVSQDYSFDVLFSTGLSEGGELMTKWDLPSPDAWRERIRTQNDGSMPREPYQRCSQSIFEAWLKPRIQAEPLIQSHFGTKLDSLVEYEDYVQCELTEVATRLKRSIKSRYVIGCDGAGSRVRREIGVKLIGGPLPSAMYLVHFKSKDLTRLHKQGQFWHIFFSSGGVIISQDEKDTWTTHLPISLDVDVNTLDPEKAIQEVLGGSQRPYSIKVDKVLVTSSWRPNICIADSYTSGGQRVFLSGDAAHQNIPTGGYGMNTALGDSFDIGWKLAAVCSGYAGKHLLASYESERRPTATRNIDRSGAHASIHAIYTQWVRDAGPGTVTARSEEGRKLREKIVDYVTKFDGENKDHGIEMGYRYNGSPVVIPDKESEEPKWNTAQYIPSTWPGARAPHVFLSDGRTSIFDLFGNDFTFVDFSNSGDVGNHFATEAKKLTIPLKTVHLPNEQHVREIWGRDAFLIRPDDHVAWRTPLKSGVELKPAEILLVAVGQRSLAMDVAAKERLVNSMSFVEENGFTGTVGNVDQDRVQGLAAFQQ